jgi:hypothetical protein
LKATVLIFRHQFRPPEEVTIVVVVITIIVVVTIVILVTSVVVVTIVVVVITVIVVIVIVTTVVIVVVVVAIVVVVTIVIVDVLSLFVHLFLLSQMYAPQARTHLPLSFFPSFLSPVLHSFDPSVLPCRAVPCRAVPRLAVPCLASPSFLASSTPPQQQKASINDANIPGGEIKRS